MAGGSRKSALARPCHVSVCASTERLISRARFPCPFFASLARLSRNALRSSAGISLLQLREQSSFARDIERERENCGNAEATAGDLNAA